MPPMFPVILTPAPPIPLTRLRAVRGEVRPVKKPRAVTRSDTIPMGAGTLTWGSVTARGTKTLPSRSRAVTTGAGANLAVPMVVRRPRSAPTRPRTHGGRTGRGPARAVSSTRPQTASGARARDASPHPRTHRE